MGSAIQICRKNMEVTAESAAQCSSPIQHVKDGKPLTAHGAKLLGVAWPVS